MTNKTDTLTSKPMDYEVIGLTHARYGGRDFYGEHASDMAELAYLRDWKRWGESKFRTLMRNHSVDIAQYERAAPETSSATLTPIEQLLVEWWGSEMENAELFNRAVRLSEPLAKAMMELPERAAQETSAAHCIDCIELKNALAAAVGVANEARECHDRDQDMRTMKLLIALSGHLPKWRTDTDRIHDVLRRAVERLSEKASASHPNDAFRWICSGCTTVNGLDWKICHGCWRYVRVAADIDGEFFTREAHHFHLTCQCGDCAIRRAENGRRQS